MKVNSFFKKLMWFKIPFGCYCDRCPYWKHIETRNLNRNNCDFSEECTEEKCDCKHEIVECKYMDYIDEKEETLLWDGVKECRCKDWDFLYNNYFNRSKKGELNERY